VISSQVLSAFNSVITTTTLTLSGIQATAKMIPPELQPRSFRPYIASSISSPSFSSSFPTASPYSPNSDFPSPSTSSSRSRFSASFFAHNTRIALALAPCAAFLLDLGGAPVVAILTLGLMIAYIIDSLNFKSGAFFCVWASLIAAQIAFFFSSSLIFTFNSIPLGLLAAFLCAQTNFLIGACGT
jgi:hypothetical protein